MTDALFHVDAPPAAPDPLAGLSADRRRSRRQYRALLDGRHPLELVLDRPLRLHPDAAPADDRTAPGLRCGTCVFRKHLGHHDRHYPKCFYGATETTAPRVNRSASSDLRAWWPACKDYEPREEA